MRYQFCPQCGNRLNVRKAGDEGDVPYCENCQKLWFDSFSSVSIVMVVNEFDEIALLRQGYLSDKYSSFVSGYIKPGETAEETALREVEEELGVKLDSMTPEGTVWFGRGDMLMHCFVGRARKCDFQLSEEVDAAEWTPCEDVVKTLFPESSGNAAFAMYKKFMDGRKSKRC